jgi:hypothetical protein
MEGPVERMGKEFTVERYDIQHKNTALVDIDIRFIKIVCYTGTRGFSSQPAVLYC